MKREAYCEPEEPYAADEFLCFLEPVVARDAGKTASR